MREFDSYYELFTENVSHDRFRILNMRPLVQYILNSNDINIKNSNDS